MKVQSRKVFKSVKISKDGYFKRVNILIFFGGNTVSDFVSFANKWKRCSVVHT